MVWRVWVLMLLPKIDNKVKKWDNLCFEFIAQNALYVFMLCVYICIYIYVKINRCLFVDGLVWVPETKIVLTITGQQG